MKQSVSNPSRVVRSFALIAGVLTVTFVAVPPAARAGEVRAPHEVLHRVHEQVRERVLHGGDRAGRYHDGYRSDHRRRSPGRVYDHRYQRPSHRYGAYRPHGYYNHRRYVSGYIGIAPIGIGYDVRPVRRVYRDDCNRRDRYGRGDYCDADRCRHVDDDRRRYYDYDDDYDDDYVD